MNTAAKIHEILELWTRERRNWAEQMCKIFCIGFEVSLPRCEGSELRRKFITHRGQQWCNGNSYRHGISGGIRWWCAHLLILISLKGEFRNVYAIPFCAEDMPTCGAETMNRIPTGYCGKHQTLMMCAQGMPTCGADAVWMDGLLKLRAKACQRTVHFCRSCWRADREGGIHVGLIFWLLFDHSEK